MLVEAKTSDYGIGISKLTFLLDDGIINETILFTEFQSGVTQYKIGMTLLQGEYYSDHANDEITIAFTKFLERVLELNGTQIEGS